MTAQAEAPPPQAAAPPPPPAPVPPREPELGDTAMAQAMTAARAAAASETAGAQASVNHVESAGSVDYEPEMGAGENVTPVSDAEGDDTDTAT